MGTCVFPSFCSNSVLNKHTGCEYFGAGMSLQLVGMCNNVPSEFLLAVQAGSEYSVSVAELRRQVEALRTLDTCLAALSAQQPEAFEGLSIRIYHPDSRPSDMDSYVNLDGSYNLHSRKLTVRLCPVGGTSFTVLKILVLQMADCGGLEPPRLSVMYLLILA